jgi:hypothetical protein
MIRKPKFGKIAIVVFITVLIWVWADLALDEELPVYSATISIVRSNPQFWVSFDDASSIHVEEMVLKGPLRKIAEIRRKSEEEGLKIDFDAAKEKMNEPGTYPLPLLPFLQKDEEIERLGLKVESCDPDTVSVKVVKLVSRRLDVKCVDEEQNPVGQATVEPLQVEMLVPEDWGPDKRIAEVMLTRREIEQARVSAIDETPYIRLAAGQTREAPKLVKVTMPPEPDRLSNYTITKTTLSIALSQTLLGKYDVKVTNMEEVLSYIAIKATPEAKQAYEMQSFPLRTLYILDEDRDATEEPKREIYYNFPEEYVSRGEIKLNQQPVIARFKLIPISSAEASKVPPG